MSGKLTARADGLINIFQNSQNPLLISALYGGADVKLRALKDLSSVNTGVAFDDSGYVNAAGKLTLVSDAGKIGTGKGIRILADNVDAVDASASGVFIDARKESSGSNVLNIGKVTVSGGNFGVFSTDVIVNFIDVVTAALVDLNVYGVIQNESTSSIIANLSALAANGISLDSGSNQIGRAFLSSSGDITLKNKSALSIDSADAGGSLYIRNEGDVSIMNTASGKNSVSIDIIGSLASAKKIRSEGNVSIKATGSINARTITGLSVDLKSSQAASSIAKNVIQSAGMNLDLHLSDMTTDKHLASGRSANAIADSGGINVHELLAREDVTGLSDNGDILLANVEGKRVVLIVNHDDGNINIDRARLGESIKISGDNFTAGLIDHTDALRSLNMGFSGINGTLMNDVTIDRINTDSMVQVDYLRGHTADIFADCDRFWLNDVTIMNKATFANNQAVYEMVGNTPMSRGVDVKLSGSGVSVVKRVERGKNETIASIIKNNNDLAEQSGRDSSNSERDESGSMIDYSEIIGSADDFEGNLKLSLKNDGIVLTSAESEEDDEEKTSEKEKSEMGNEK